MTFKDVISVTRFGGIPPLWQNFKSLVQFLGLFSIWQNFERNLANFYAIIACFVGGNGNKLKTYAALWSHWM